jgi:hypothetical protein
MADDTQNVLARLDHEATHALELAGLYARTLESLARRMQGVTTGELPADKAALRSAALRLSHAATEATAALVSVVVQSARLDMLATVRPLLEPKDAEPSDK